MDVLRRIMAMIVLLSFSLTTVVPVSMASTAPWMPHAGSMVELSPVFIPAHLKGMIIDPVNPFMVDFIISRGDASLTQGKKQEEYQKLVKYFLAALAVPDEDQWVNLSPYEKDRMIPDIFGRTEMGRDLLSQDYLLKQISASLTNPNTEIGRKFWDNIYAQAYQKFGVTTIPTDTFNKIWIMPDKATVYEKGNMVYVIDHHLKVMTEADYQAMNHNGIGIEASGKNNVAEISTQVVREVIVPAIEKEVNEGMNFAQLRQVYSGMILSAWYKHALKESILYKVYGDRSKVAGIEQDPKNNLQIYEQYLSALKQGVFNMIKEEVDVATQEVIPRKYFSGGVIGDNEQMFSASGFVDRVADMPKDFAENNDVARVELSRVDMAMTAVEVAVKLQGMQQNRDYYEWLGLERKASKAEIKAAYRKLIVMWHPEKHPEAKAETKFRSDLEEVTKLLNAAWEILKDDKKKSSYDSRGPEVRSAGPSASASSQNKASGGGFWEYFWSSSNQSEGADDFDGAWEDFESDEAAFARMKRERATRPLDDILSELDDETDSWARSELLRTAKDIAHNGRFHEANKPEHRREIRRITRFAIENIKDRWEAKLAMELLSVIAMPRFERNGVIYNRSRESSSFPELETNQSLAILGLIDILNATDDFGTILLAVNGLGWSESPLAYRWLISDLISSQPKQADTTRTIVFHSAMNKDIKFAGMVINLLEAALKKVAAGSREYRILKGILDEIPSDKKKAAEHPYEPKVIKKILERDFYVVKANNPSEEFKPYNSQWIASHRMETAAVLWRGVLKEKGFEKAMKLIKSLAEDGLAFDSLRGDIFNSLMVWRHLPGSDTEVEVGLNMYGNNDGRIYEELIAMARKKLTQMDRDGVDLTASDDAQGVADVSKGADMAKGGIDFSQKSLDLQIKRDGNGVPLPVSQQDLDGMRIEGLVPVIINICPVSSMPGLTK